MMFPVVVVYSLEIIVASDNCVIQMSHSRLGFRSDLDNHVNLMNHQGNLHDMIQVRGSGNKKLQVKQSDMA
jgi:hypothetical protein